jgi:hypothetical protein
MVVFYRCVPFLRRGTCVSSTIHNFICVSFASIFETQSKLRLADKTQFAKGQSYLQPDLPVPQMPK